MYQSSFVPVKVVHQMEKWTRVLPWPHTHGVKLQCGAVCMTS